MAFRKNPKITIKTNPNETNYTGGEKHFTDVIKNQGNGELLIWRAFEEDFNVNSTLIVMPGEAALFVKGGVIEQEFEEGTYKLDTNNYPFLSRLLNAFSGGISTFNCVVYFVRKAHSKEIPWGFSLQVRDPKLQIATRLMARGAYKIQVDNAALLLTKLLGNNVNVLRQENILDYFRSEFAQHIKSALASFVQNSNEEILGIVGKQTELANSIEPTLIQIYKDYGLFLAVFSIEGLEVPEDDPNRQKLEAAYATKTESAIYGAEYGKFVQREILTDLANNPAGGVAAAGAGLGMGLGTAPVFGGMAQSVFNTGSGAAAASGTPAELMKQLKEMLDMGAITQEEFDVKKKEILGRM